MTRSLLVRLGLVVALVALLLPGCSSKSSKAVTLTPGNFDAKVLQSKQPVLVDFWAEWCGPCRMMDPVIKELAAEFEGKVVVGQVNVEDYPDIAGRYSIDGLPTLLIFQDGALKRRIVGAQSKQSLVKLMGTLQ